MKKVALLVLAATAPETLFALTRTLGKHFAIYVHLDSKCDLSHFKGKYDWQNVIFIPNRVEVFWAGFSMIEASVSLMDFASKSGAFSHYCLISDDTLSLLDPDALLMRIRSSPDWIQLWKVPEDHLFQQRYRRFFFLDSRFSTPRWLLTEQRSFEPSDFRSLLELEYLRQRGKFPLENLYCGKQWWVLGHESLSDLLQFHYANEHFRLSFKYSAVSDEIYFQTIYKMIRPNVRVSGNPLYDDFTREPKPYCFGSVEEITSSGNFEEWRRRFLFIRKIRLKDPGASEQIRTYLWAASAAATRQESLVQ